MYAVIKTGGKQYKVAKDDILIIEKLPGDAGSVVQFDQVLMVGGAGKSSVGAPLVAGAVVTATVLEQQQGDKILIFKKRRRKNYRRKKGHRQLETVVRIAGIYTDGAKPDLTAAAPEKKPAAKKAAKKAAPKAKKAE
jgi:large subunit ribosomal protein L21